MLSKTLVVTLLYFVRLSYSCLFPYESETRQTKSLNGLWSFKIINGSSLTSSLDKTDKDVIKMPVPSSFNDITTSAALRDHNGLVVYETQFYAPLNWKDPSTRVFVHFGGVHYHSFVFLNGVKVGTNIGGHLPFELELTAHLRVGANTLTVNVNNILTPNSLPQGKIINEKPDWSAKNITTYTHNCDYFDYAGINRPVTLFTTPINRICGVYIETYFENKIGVIDYSIDDCESMELNACEVRLFDQSDEFVVSSNGPCTSQLFVVKNLQLWWPILLDRHTPGYLYTMEIYLFGPNSTSLDVYRLPVGIRTISWSNNSLFINNEQVYLRGVGMHEDSNLRGRGFDNVVLARDMNLMEWLGANSFRTSHYPYAEETLNEADARGILVIVETPACSLDQFGDKIRKEHERILKQMIQQHKHRPSVIMWSLANEPQTDKNESAEYFRHLSEVARNYDKSRPVTFVTSQHCLNDKAKVNTGLSPVFRGTSVDIDERYRGLSFTHLGALPKSFPVSWVTDPDQYQKNTVLDSGDLKTSINNGIGMKYMDLVCINRYEAWYERPGRLEYIYDMIRHEIQLWHARFNKAVVVTEYGAGSLPGFHSLPSTMWTEDYQLELHEQHFKAFDELNGKGLVGEMVWNFIDFNVPQEFNRPGRCSKGLFTRERQPKAAAHVVRNRYHKLAQAEVSPGSYSCNEL